MVLDAVLFNAQYYEVRIKGKVKRLRMKYLSKNGFYKAYKLYFKL